MSNQQLPKQPSGRVGGNRGFSRLPWRYGPREPHRSLGCAKRNPPVTLLVDRIPVGMSTSRLRIIFEKEGCVEDVFISKKAKKFKKEAFGFVRYARLQETRNAIIYLDGFAVSGMRLRFSMARYKKGGSTIRI